MTETSSQAETAQVAAGPLVVSRANPRYFSVASRDPSERKVVYLTGSHIWNNLQDGVGPGDRCSEVPERNDYRAYLDFLKEHGHNFIRLWRWEHFLSVSPDRGFHLCMTPQPWPRSGPGRAKDGNPKFDLSKHDESYFIRLRERVRSAGAEGIYVAVMLFDGFALHLSPPPNNIEGHPFYVDNNINDIRIRSIVDYQVFPLDARIRSIQEAYVRKVVDTVHDLPNVLYEVVNESSGTKAESVQLPDGSTIATPIGDSTLWQYWIIELIKQHEREMGYEPHPVGMTMQYPVANQALVNDSLYKSLADWISPGFDEKPAAAEPGQGPVRARWFWNPPANHGTKVIISDTDHYAPGRGDALWAWKSFLRGHNPVLMDFGIIDLKHPSDPVPGVPSYAAFEPARHAMGDTRRFAQRVSLVDMVPRGDLSTTGYALAHPGSEYLALEPGPTRASFTLKVEAGKYSVEWFSVEQRTTLLGSDVMVETFSEVPFNAPFAGPALLYLKNLRG